MQFFDEQTIRDLEFDKIREQLTAYCLNPTAAKHMAQLKPIPERNRCMMELESSKEMLDIRQLGERFPAIDFEELADEIKLLRVRNAVVSQEGFLRIYRASVLTNELITFFNKREKEFPRLTALTGIVYFTTDLIEAIDNVFDKRGKIKDDASPELQGIRSEIKDVRARIHKHFEREMKRLIKMGILSDTREGFLNERRVLAVLSSHKREVGGSVLGSSKTGGITYIEPAATLPLNNELELLIDDERKEVFRILKALTKDIALHVELIENYQRLLTRFDFINAKSKFALSIKATLPGIDETEQHIELIDAFHPLLWQANQAAGLKTIPQTLLIDKFSRMLVISGPNAGGKSITLKTVGLLQVMLQSGLLVPVHPNSRMGFFQQVLTDIGDNQSIVNQLSTYSYRLKRMKHFLEVANRRSLLLLDEFGTGSDPELGGALAEVFFETLYNKKCFGVITTHYNNIKLKAGQLKNARNGCMLFDTESLEPLYQLSIGQPGSSFTFEVAQMNGIPQALIEEAKTRLDSKKVLLDQMISALQKEKGQFEKLNHNSRQTTKEAEEAKKRFEDAKTKFEERSKTQQEIIERNNKYLTSGKKMKQFIDRFQVGKQAKTANKKLLEEVMQFLAIEKSKILESKEAERLKQEAEAASKRFKKPQKATAKSTEIPMVVGSRVKLEGNKEVGTVMEISGQEVIVAYGMMRVKVPRKKLVVVR
jgi:DNA mismatch repair protein MutS2